MKLPGTLEIGQAAYDGLRVQEGYGAYKGDGGGYPTAKEFVDDNQHKMWVGEAVLDLIGRFNLASESEEAQPQVDPNLVRIAELEAQVKVYESVINAAGIQLGIPKPKKQVKSASNRGKE